MCKDYASKIRFVLMQLFIYDWPVVRSRSVCKDISVFCGYKHAHAMPLICWQLYVLVFIYTSMLHSTKWISRWTWHTTMNFEAVTYPVTSSNEPRRLFRRWLAVTANGPIWPDVDSSSKAPVGSVSVVSAIGVTTHIEPERRSGRPLGVRDATEIGAPNSTANWPARVGSEPASYEPALSRRKRPITDLTGLGLDSPPMVLFCCFVFVCETKGVKTYAS